MFGLLSRSNSSSKCVDAFILRVSLLYAVNSKGLGDWPDFFLGSF